MMHIVIQYASPHHLLHSSHGDYTFFHAFRLALGMAPDVYGKSSYLIPVPRFLTSTLLSVSPGLQHVTDKAVLGCTESPSKTSVPLPQCFALQLPRRPIYGC
jgi:hypothetical protein